MLIVRLKGGLGNQMFQYAFARRLAIESGAIVKLDTTNGFKNDFFERRFCLNNFRITLAEADQADLEKYRYTHDTFAGRIGEKIKRMKKSYEEYIIREKKQFSYEPEHFNNNNDKYYDGYWQDTNYFNCIRDVLINEFELKPHSNLTEIMHGIENNNSVGVHIRTPHYLGGRLNDFKTYNRYEILTREYYISALNYLNDINKDLKIYLFTNDINYSKNIIGETNNYMIISNEDYEDLYLLSKCKHQIISNSTFSWWGAWLNRNINKCIITPRYWYKDHTIQNESLIHGFIKI